ncbi:MAG: hypothetical protein LBF93_05825 [Zoogloeaceae bacterium]|jgi:hypothetical protein|nr:hypothetical protein [Zoogloeaceae bacterium]
MRVLSLAFTFLLLASGSVFALDKADEGVYALVHKDGHVTKKIARLGQQDGRWRIEDRKPDGSWEDVTCEEGCALIETTPAQVTRFLEGTALQGTTMQCVHNPAFAFCRVERAGRRSYYMLAFSGGAVIPLKWVRLDAETLEPAGAP